jgi:hypothetical protein
MAVAPAALAKTVKCRSPEYDVRHLSATNVKPLRSRSGSTYSGCWVAQRVAIEGDNWLNPKLFTVSTLPHYRFTLRVCPRDAVRCERWHYKFSEPRFHVTAWHRRQSITFMPFT